MAQNCGHRKSNIEIIKVIGIILIVLSHALPYGEEVVKGAKIIDLRLASNSYQQFLMVLMRYAGQFGNLFFLIPSVWFLIDSERVKIEKVLNIVLNSFFISSIFIVLSIILKIPIIRIDVVRMIFPTAFGLYWFLSSYLIMYLIHPYLNYVIKKLSKREHLLSVLIMAFCYSFFSVYWRQTFSWTNTMGFIYIYILIAYFKIYVYKSYYCFSSTTKMMLTAIILGLFHFSFILSINLLGLRIKTFHDDVLRFCIFTNPIIIASCLCFFCGVLAAKEFENGIINYFSSISMLIYLFHGNLFFSKYLRFEYYKWAYHHESEGGILIWILVYAVFLIVFGVATGVIYRCSIGAITDRISKWGKEVVIKWLES